MHFFNKLIERGYVKVRLISSLKKFYDQYCDLIKQYGLPLSDTKTLKLDSSRAPGLTSGLQGSVNVHRGALLLVPQ